ncbi:hypothetical protein LUZ60_005969 [Juncus effusus]|nr:hypothetical protein LUZ60_005969 [Juncus effusus]
MSYQARPSSHRNQMRYVPKTSPNPNSHPPLTTSLRSSSAVSPAGEIVIDGNFVAYLPQDEAVASGLGPESGGLDAVEAQSVVDLLNEELKRLLVMKPRDFWKEVARNSSLHRFLDSYLKFRHRWYDLPYHGPKEAVAGIVVGEMDLCRRVFMILFRISSNKDPGSASSDSLSMKDHTALLQEKKLLDLPKLLDMCAIYAHENQELTSLLVTNAIKAQKISFADISNVASQFLNIVHTMHERCISSLQVLSASVGHDTNGYSQLHKDFLEVLDFINDAVVTLDAFVNAYKPAAFSFCASFEMSYGVDELLTTLARLHDSLLPTLIQGFNILSSSLSTGDIQSSLKLLSKRLIKLGWILLDQCYLNDLLNESELREFAIMVPAKVEDPLIRGEILLQKLNELREFAIIGGALTFLQGLEMEFELLTRVNSLWFNGWIYLEQSQMQYLIELIGSSQKLKSKSNFNSQINKSQKQIQKAEKDEETIMLESKISQIKDLFPDYGKGFLATCLEIYDFNPENVIQNILEGTLHKDLSSLDITLEEIQPRNPKLNTNNKKDKGKAVLVEEPVPKPDMKMKGIVINSSSSSSINNSSINNSTVPVQGRFTRKTEDSVPDTVILDSMTDKNEIRSNILAFENEYEDEYDDSFDELGLSIVESSYEESENKIGTVNSESSTGPKWSSQKKPQFYVKDGKNYSYKVAGAVAVNNSKEAALLSQAQRDLIHGLGRGGNLPHGAVKKVSGEGEEGNYGRGRGVNLPHGEGEREGEGDGEGEEGNFGRGRGRGGGRGGRGGRNYYRKDRAMKKHFASVGGF